MTELFPLRTGAHPRREDGMCAMEMVAWLAGEAHSDEPKCACPVLSAYVRALNDAMPDDTLRTRLLRPLTPRLVNSRADALVELERGLAIADAAVRHWLPTMAFADGRRALAATAAELEPIGTRERAEIALRVVVDLAPAEKALRWMLAGAASGMPPRHFATGAVRFVRDQGSPVLLAAAVELADRLLRASRAAVAN